MRKTIITAMMSAVVLLSGCGIYSKYERPALPLVDLSLIHI